MAIIASYVLPHPPVVIPEIGREDRYKIDKTYEAYDKIGKEIASLAPDTIIVSSPHAESYADYFQISDGELGTGNFAKFGAPQVGFRVLYDQEFVKKISDIARAKNFPAGSEGGQEKELDHGTMIPLYFINHYYKGYKLVRVGLSGLPLLDHYRFGQIIQEASKRLPSRVVFIASGDMSHCQKADGPYGFKPEGPKYDSMVMNALGKANFGELLSFDETLVERAEECGHRSFVIMAGALDRVAVEAKAISHEATFGVGYGICSFKPLGEDPSRAFGDFYVLKAKMSVANKRETGDPYIKLAYASLDNFLNARKGQDRLNPFVPLEMKSSRAGVFVSIHENGTLRGCIGTIEPETRSVAEEIIQNAIRAASEDPRFKPIKKEELPFLDVSVDVLSEPEDITSSKQLDPKKYGVIVINGNRRGVLLPDLPGVDTAEEQIDIARRKAHIGKEEMYSLERFTVIRHS